MSKSQRLCIFCQKQGVTKEHIWGKWSRKHAPLNFPYTNHTITEFKDFKLDGSKSVRIGNYTRTGSIRSQTLKIVCSACNNGWMSSNIDDALLVLTRMNYGYWGVLSENEKLALVRWIAEVSMKYEFLDPTTVIVPQEARTHFSETRDLIGHWIIAIGHAEILSGTEPKLHRAMGCRSKEGLIENAQVTAFMFGHLFGLAFYSEFEPPQELYQAFSDMSLAVLYPLHTDRIIKPHRSLNEACVSIVVDAVSEALQNWSATRKI